MAVEANAIPIALYGLAHRIVVTRHACSLSNQPRQMEHRNKRTDESAYEKGSDFCVFQLDGIYHVGQAKYSEQDNQATAMVLVPSSFLLTANYILMGHFLA